MTELYNGKIAHTQQGLVPQSALENTLYTHRKLRNMLAVSIFCIQVSILRLLHEYYQKKKKEVSNCSAEFHLLSFIIPGKQYEIKLVEIHPHDKCLFPVSASIL